MWKLRAVLISAPVIIILTAGMATVSLICSLWDRAGGTQHRLARRWARMLLAIGFVRAKVRGVEKLDPDASYVVVANHSSYMDIPTLYSALPLELRFFAKKGLFSIPLLGWHLHRAGHLPVVRGDARASLKAMSEGAKIMRKRGVSVLLFPEGGRTEKGIRPFKEGAAYIAIKAGAPIVPVAIVGMRALLPMGSIHLRSGQVTVRIADPVPTAGLKLSGREELTQRMYADIARML